MQYYSLKYSTGDIIGSTFPQSQHFKSELNINDPNFIWNVSGRFSSDVYIPDSILHGKAKMTDLISSSPIIYPIVSNTLKNILEKYRNEGVQYLKTHLIVKNKKIDYWLVNAFDRDYKYLKFQNSKISVCNAVTGDKKLIDIHTPSGLETAIDSVKYPEHIMIEKLHVLNDTQEHLLFIDRTRYEMYLFSEALKNEIQDAGCTGIEFEFVDIS